MKQPKPAFKTLLLLCAPIALAAALVGSCKKENHSTTQPAVSVPAVADAKSWYEKAYSASTKLATQAASVGQDWSQGVKPDWDKGATYTRYEDDVVELPVDASVSGKLNIGIKEQTTGTEYKSTNSRSSFLLIKSLGIYHAYIMTIIGDPTYLKGDLTKLEHNKYNKRDSDFTGVVLYSTPKGKFVNAWTYKNGAISGQISPDSASSGTAATGKEQINSVKTNLVAITTCYTWTQTTSYNGQSTGTTVLETYCITSYTGSLDSGSGGGGGGSIPVTGTGGGGGGGGAVPSPAPKPPCVPTTAVDNVGKVSVNSVSVNKVQPLPGDPGFPPPTGTPCTTVVTSNNTITNQATNPCLKNMVDATILAGVSNQVNTLITSVFGGSEKLNLTFVDNVSLASGVEGHTEMNGGFDANGNLNITIQLNQSTLPNYSQQFVATVIMHEALHAYLEAKGVDPKNQHENIIIDYVNKMSASLTTMFPGIPPMDAKNLSLGGLDQTTTFLYTVAKDMGLSGDYAAIQSAYSIGAAGTRCK